MSLSGSLNTMPLPDLLQWLDSAHKTGTLVLEGPDYSTTLYIKDGRVISSASKDPRSYFGQFLLAHTDLSEEDLRRGFDLQEKTRVYLGKNIYIKTMLGKILVEERILSEKDVRRVLRIKAEETIYPAFLWPHGSFRFLSDELPPEELVPLSLDVVEVLNRGPAHGRVAEHPRPDPIERRHLQGGQGPAQPRRRDR